MDYCFQCKWFADAKLHHTYVSPRCTVLDQEGDDCSYVRAHVCGVEDATLYEPRCQAYTVTIDGEDHNAKA